MATICTTLKREKRPTKKVGSLNPGDCCIYSGLLYMVIKPNTRSEENNNERTEVLCFNGPERMRGTIQRIDSNSFVLEIPKIEISYEE